MTTLRQLAEAAKGWAPTHAIPANDEDLCFIGVMDTDDRFEGIGALDLENHFGDSMLLANFIIAAIPSAILALLDDLDLTNEMNAQLREQNTGLGEVLAELEAKVDAQRKLLERVAGFLPLSLHAEITAHLEATK